MMMKGVAVVCCRFLDTRRGVLTKLVEDVDLCSVALCCAV
jgi:hypothetical protein